MIVVYLIIISFLCLLFHSNLRAEQAFSFSSGVVFAMYAKKYIKIFEEDDKKLIIYTCILIGIGLVLFFFRQSNFVRVLHMELYKYINLFMKLCFAYGIIIGTYFKFLGGGDRWHKVAWKWMAKYAYSLYLVHGYFIFIVSKNLFGNFVVNTFIFFLVSFFVSKLLTLFTNHLARRIVYI